MNISVERLEVNDGSGLEDRPEYVRESLDTTVEVGYQDGRPVVAPPDGRPEHVPLGNGVAKLYGHYRRGDNLLRPDAGTFVRELFDSEHVEAVTDAADELNTDTDTVRKATELHGIDTPAEADADEGDSTDRQLTLPSGETVESFEPLHPLVLSQLISDGLSTEEAARYLSRETDERITESDVLEAAQEHRLIGDGGDDGTPQVPARKKAVTTGETDVANSPW